MTLTLTHYGKTITIQEKRDDLTIDEVIDLVRALLLAAGFAEQSITEALGEQ